MDVEAYALLTLCADIQGAMDAFDHRKVAMVGHDWGAPVAWHLALLEPQRVRALVALSVPFAGQPRRPATQVMAELYAERFNYILYFQEPGLAEQALEADIEQALLAFMGRPGAVFKTQARDVALVRRAAIADAAFAVYRATFAEHGFRGALNGYRNVERNWQRSAFLAEARVQVPTLFMIGDRDPVGQLAAHTIERMPTRVDDLQVQVLEDCGHWIQSE